MRPLQILHPVSLLCWQSLHGRGIVLTQLKALGPLRDASSVGGAPSPAGGTRALWGRIGRIGGPPSALPSSERSGSLPRREPERHVA